MSDLNIIAGKRASQFSLYFLRPAFDQLSPIRYGLRVKAGQNLKKNAKTCNLSNFVIL